MALLSAFSSTFAASPFEVYERRNPGDAAVFYCQDLANRKSVSSSDRPAFLRQCINERINMGGSTRPEESRKSKAKP
jgi:hypothetical protein